MNVWQLITTSSGLPVGPTVTLWDHLNNLGQGGGTTIVQAAESASGVIESLSVSAKLEAVTAVGELESLDVVADLEEIDARGETD